LAAMFAKSGRNLSRGCRVKFTTLGVNAIGQP